LQAAQKFSGILLYGKGEAEKIGGGQWRTSLCRTAEVGEGVDPL